MPRTEPLRALLLLRRIESQDATLRLMAAREAQQQAANASRRHAEVLRAEIEQAGGDSLAAWLPAARGEADRATARLAVAEAGFAAARASAASAGLSERAVRDEIRRRERARRATVLAGEQHRLGDVAWGHDDGR